MVDRPFGPLHFVSSALKRKNETTHNEGTFLQRTSYESPRSLVMTISTQIQIYCRDVTSSAITLDGRVLDGIISWNMGQIHGKSIPWGAERTPAPAQWGVWFLSFRLFIRHWKECAPRLHYWRKRSALNAWESKLPCTQRSRNQDFSGNKKNAKGGRCEKNAKISYKQNTRLASFDQSSVGYAVMRFPAGSELCVQWGL